MPDLCDKNCVRQKKLDYATETNKPQVSDVYSNEATCFSSDYKSNYQEIINVTFPLTHW